MSTTRSFFGKNRGESESTAATSASAEPAAVVAPKSAGIQPGTAVEVVRFNGQFMVGRVLEPKSSLTDGERFRGGTVKLSYLNETFLSVEFDKVDGKDSYVQLIPWAAVATVILK